MVFETIVCKLDEFFDLPFNYDVLLVCKCVCSCVSLPNIFLIMKITETQKDTLNLVGVRMYVYLVRVSCFYFKNFKRYRVG